MANKEQFVIRLGMETTGVTAGVSSAVGQITRLYNSATNILSKLAPIGTIIGSAFKFLRDGTADANDLNDMAVRAESTARAMQALRFSAEALKVPMEDFLAVIDKIKKAQSEALQGGEAQTKDFARLGYTIKDLKSIAPEEIFLRVSAAAARGEISVANYASVLSIMGKESAKLIPNLKKDIAGLAEEFDKSGNAIPKGLLESLDEADGMMSKWWAKRKAEFRSERANFAGTVKNFWDAMIGARDTIKGSPWPGESDSEESKKSRESGIDSFSKIILGNDEDNDAALELAEKNENLLKRKTAIKALEKFNKEEKEAQEKKKLEEKEQRQAEAIARKGIEGAPPSTDALARIGIDRGGGGELARIPQMQLTELQGIRSHIQKLVTVTEKKSPTPEADKIVSGLNEISRILRGGE